ncbi:hypothetical protein Tco_1509841 [Tanacetum coccineum]
MDLETAQITTTAKLPTLKQGEYDMWRLRIEQYFQVQDYALWDVIENGNSFKPAAKTTTNADGTSTTLIPGPVTTEEKVQKKNDMKARSMLLMALPNEHLMTFNQYKDAKTLFAAIQTRFGGNEATKKTQKTLLKQMYENFSAPSTESLDSIFNRLQKIVSQLAILGENISQEDLNLKFLRSLPSEWNTHVVVWRNKPDLDTMSFDDLYNNFKIVEQEVKGTASSSSSSNSQNMAFVSSPSSTNEVNTAYGVSTANTQVSPASTQVSTASTQVSTANLSDDTVYAFLASQPNGSQLVYEDLEQIHEDDLEEMDLKWQLALLSMRTRRGKGLSGLRELGLCNGPVKYGWAKVYSQSIHIDSAKIESIRDWSAPKTLTKVCQFLADALSEEQVKPLRVRTLVMTINLNLSSQILDAQAEAIKEENVKNENLRNMDKEFETRPDGTRCIRSKNLKKFYGGLTMKAEPFDKYVEQVFDMHKDFGNVWDKHLPLVKFSYNNNYHTSIKVAPFKAPNCLPRDKSKPLLYQPKRVRCLRRKPSRVFSWRQGYVKVSPWKGLVLHFGKWGKIERVHSTFHVSNLKKCTFEESLVILLEEIQIDDKLHFVEEPIEFMDREVKRLKQSRIPIIKVRWNSRRGPEFMWEREDQFRSKYPHLFTNTTPVGNTN